MAWGASRSTLVTSAKAARPTLLTPRPRSSGRTQWAGRRRVRCTAEGGGFTFEDVAAPEKKKVAAPKAAAPAAPAEPKSQEFPGFPKLLWQTRSKVTGDPVRVIELPDGPGILGAGEALMCMPIPGLVGSRLLLLDDTSNIHSVYHPNEPGKLTGAYWDLMAAVDPLLPAEGAFAVLGLGGGTVAQNIHKYWPEREMEGWELDPEVIDAARPHLGIAELEAKGRLKVHCDDAFAAKPTDPEGFACIFVDLFSESQLLPQEELQETWDNLLGMLRPQGRLIANLGSPNTSDAEGLKKTQNSYMALAQACGGFMCVYNDRTAMIHNVLVMTGPCPLPDSWKKSLPAELHHLANDWMVPGDIPAR